MPKENRKYPRKNKKLALNLIIDNSDVTVGESVNMSCIGAYCQTNKHILEMTRLSIAMVLPHKSEEEKFVHVKCNGIVVRSESGPPETNLCNMAIYFNEIEEFERNKIAAFLELL